MINDLLNNLPDWLKINRNLPQIDNVHRRIDDDERLAGEFGSGRPARGACRMAARPYSGRAWVGGVNVRRGHAEQLVE